MALRERDLYAPTTRPRPALALVPPPRKHHPVAASVFVLLLGIALAVPIVSAALEPAPPVPRQVPRSLPAGSIATLDRLRGMGGGDIPRSYEPLAGIAFVRCTGLWFAGPDGSAPRRLLPISGISSPAFSNDGRTIAFVRTEEGRVQSLWLAAADGSSMKKVGVIEFAGDPVPARVSGLAWRPEGDRIAFALSDDTHGALAGGSAIWTVDLSSGSFDRVASGWPAPAWYGRHLFAGRYDDTPDVQVTSVDGAERFENRINSGYDDVAITAIPTGWWNTKRNGIAILRSSKQGMHLALRDGWRDRDHFVVEPPAGYRFARYGQPTITQDGSRIAVDLLDSGAGRDIGLFDPANATWELLDYAWEPSASPAPTIIGEISKQDARVATQMLLDLWSRRPERAEMLTRGRPGADDFPWKRFGWMVRDPFRSEGRWVVPVVTFSYGAKDDPYEYRSADVIVQRSAGRLTATPVNVDAITRVETLEDALGFAEVATGRSLPSLPPLPQGSRLARNYALSAWRYGGNTQVTINTLVPSDGSTGGSRRMSFSFGDNLDFSLGCGGAIDPDPVEIAGGPGMADRSGPTNQVLWPATPDDLTGSYSIYGEVPRAELIDLAEAMSTG